MAAPRAPKLKDESLQDLVHEVESREQLKEQRQMEREEKKRLKEAQKKHSVQEKLVAPVLLMLTIVVSFIIWLLS